MMLLLCSLFFIAMLVPRKAAHAKKKAKRKAIKTLNKVLRSLPKKFKRIRACESTTVGIGAAKDKAGSSYTTSVFLLASNRGSPVTV